MTQGVCMFDARNQLILSNHRYAELYGIEQHAIRPGITVDQVIAQRFETAGAPAMDWYSYQRFCHDIAASGQPHSCLVKLRNGRTIAVVHQPLADGGWVGTHEDVSARLDVEPLPVPDDAADEIPLLPGMAGILDHLQVILAHNPPEPCAVFMIGLDRLWLANTSLSRPDRDQLVQTVAARLRDRFRSTDLIGDVAPGEFAVVLRETIDAIGVTRRARTVLDLIAEPIELAGREIILSSSIGVAVAAAACGLGAETILDQAGIALHRAQQDGPGNCRLFQPEMDALLQERRALEVALRAAMQTMAFEVHYQPQMALDPIRHVWTVRAFEALVRWTDPSLGRVSPAVFIPLAEELGLLGHICTWVLDRACADCVTWVAPDRDRSISVAVNISARQFEDERLPDIVGRVLARHNLAPHRLELEVTESDIIADRERASARMQALHALGVSVALDDFGTGFSSLSYLPNLAFDRIKIDQSFVAQLGDSVPHLAIVRAIIALSRGLGTGCVAEGVESRAQLAILATEGCVEAQGYLFGRPGPASAATAMLVAPCIPAETPNVQVPGVIGSEDLFQAIVTTTNDVVIVTDAELDSPGPTILFVNSAFERLTGYTAAEAIGRSPRMLQGPGTSRATLDEIRQGLTEGREVHRKVLNYAKSGMPYWLDLRIVALRDEAGRIQRFAAIERDVTLDKRRFDELEHLADRDVLTGIANRRSLLRTMEAELDMRQSHSQGPCLAYIDVDHFKRINDEHGHSVGDVILFGVADRLGENMRRMDTLGRIGGEEFAICMPGLALEDAALIAARLCRAIAAEPFDTPVGPIRATVSVGVAESDPSGNVAGLIERADRAMYAAKTNGRNRVVTEREMATLPNR